jgi:hypothetical protein
MRVKDVMGFVTVVHPTVREVVLRVNGQKAPS